MSDELLPEALAENIADQVSKGLVTYDRARKQLAQMQATPGNTIDIGEVLVWLDKHIKRSGHEEVEVDGVTIDVPVDHSKYFEEDVQANREIIEIQKQIPFSRQGRAIDVSGRIGALEARADEELGVTDAG